jgi:hypothetical protein
MPPVTDWEADWRRFVDTSLPGRVRHPRRYLDLEAAVASLDWLADHGFGVLGIEGFEEALMTHIADCSALWSQADFVTESIQESRATLTSWADQVDLVDLAIQRPDA